MGEGYRKEPIKGKNYDTILAEGCAIAKSFGDYWISAGTSLGLFRDGEPIENDCDLDIGMFEPKDVVAIESAFYDKGYRYIRKADYDGKPHQRAFIKDDVIFDIYFYYRDGDFLLNYNNYGMMRKPAYLIDEFEFINYKENTYRMPKSPDYYVWRYGEDWETPIRDSADWSMRGR